MSMRIYDHYEWKRNLNSLFAFCIELRKKEHARLKAEFMKMTKEQRGKLYDETHDRRNFMQRGSWEFDTSIMIYPYGQRLFFGLFGFNYSNPILETVQQDSRVVDFHYQNQSDRPDHISPQEWRARRRVWDKIGERSHVFAEMGLSFQVTSLDTATIMLIMCAHEENQCNEN